MAVARLMFDVCIPFNTLNSIYFQPMFDAVVAVGPGYKGPTYHSMRVNLLKDCKKEVSLLVETYRSNWADTGCTIMADGWTDVCQRTLINFLVYCPRGISFVKLVDASDIVKDVKSLFQLFNDMVEWVGPSNVIQLVTDNAANYVAAGKLLCERYPNISWSSCASHCLNLILKDIAKMDHMENLAKRSSKVTIFVYNHVFMLSWLRKRPQWREIIRPGVTRFATTFIALNSLHEHKHDLRALVVSRYFVDSRLAKTSKAKEAVSIIMDDKFCNDCLIIVKIAAPLIRLLRIVDFDEKPAMGYVYEGMYRARLGIKKLFKFKRLLYKPYTRVIKDRWDRQLRRNIHGAAYWLNPAFQYDQESFANKLEVMNGVLDMIDTKATGSKGNLLDETRIFRDRLESFSRELALTLCKTTQPDEWWRLFGHSTPNLQKLAIRFLSQTTSSSGCERNWSVFERIHNKKKNRLEHQRLNDLVYVHYNLRLKNRLHYKKRSYDPVDYDSIDKTEFWIVQEEGTSELNYEELEEMLYGNGGVPRNEGQSNCSLDVAKKDNEGGEKINLDTFGGVDDEDGSNNNDDDDDGYGWHD